MTTETTEIKTDERKVDRFMSVPDSHISYNHVTHNVGVRITQQQLEKVDECYRQHNPAYKPTRESEGLIDADGFDNWNYFYIPESMKRIDDETWEVEKLKPREEKTADGLTTLANKIAMIIRRRMSDGFGKQNKIDFNQIMEVLTQQFVFCKVPSEAGKNRRPDIDEYCTVRNLNQHGIHSTPGNIYIYDPDRGIYVDVAPILDFVLVAIAGRANNSYKNDIISTLNGMFGMYTPNTLIPYIPLPNFKIVVGNGVFNLITRELEPFDPRFVALSSIEVNYYPHRATHIDARKFGTMSFKSLCESFAHGNQDRVRLVEQICKYAVIGSAPQDAGFIIYGEGGDGKSTFFESMLGNIVGAANTATLTLSDIEKNDENKLADIAHAKYILGTDNNSRLYLKNTSVFKRIVTGDVIGVRRIYEPARKVASQGVMCQLVNEMPKFAETGNAIRRRFVVVKAENSYVANKTDSKSVASAIKDGDFLEHCLAYILDCVPYYDGFNQVDSNLIEESAQDSNPVIQFMQALMDSQFFGNGLAAVPLQDLHTAYTDWFNANIGNNAKPLSRPSFKAAIMPMMKNLGFKEETKRINAGINLANGYGYDRAKFTDTDMRGKNFENLKESSQRTVCFVREGESIDISEAPLMNDVRHSDVECSVYDYLLISNFINRNMTREEKKEYWQIRMDELDGIYEDCTIINTEIIFEHADEVAEDENFAALYHEKLERMREKGEIDNSPRVIKETPAPKAPAKVKDAEQTKQRKSSKKDDVKKVAEVIEFTPQQPETPQDKELSKIDQLNATLPPGHRIVDKKRIDGKTRYVVSQDGSSIKTYLLKPDGTVDTDAVMRRVESTYDEDDDARNATLDNVNIVATTAWGDAFNDGEAEVADNLIPQTGGTLEDVTTAQSYYDDMARAIKVMNFNSPMVIGMINDLESTSTIGTDTAIMMYHEITKQIFEYRKKWIRQRE